MPYDASLDKEVFTKSHENDDGKITVSVHSYNNGPKKLQVVRENRDQEGGLRFAKLGRMTKDEVQAVLPLIQEALSNM
jgi:predicted transcriptional regulator